MNCSRLPTCVQRCVCGGGLATQCSTACGKTGGTGGTGAGGAGGVGGSGGADACALKGQSCGMTPCCAGLCSGGQCVCTDAGGNCQSGNDCCSGVCAAGICAQCNGNGAVCHSNANCCSGSCQAGVCACAPMGAGCVDSSGCCSGSCIGNQCSCVATGAVCSANSSDCCSGTCGPHSTCCGDVGTPCQSPSDCCSDECFEGQCATRCPATGTCAKGRCVPQLQLCVCLTRSLSLERPCKADSDCCSGTCSGGICACSQTGEPCGGASVDCCSGLTCNADRCG
jgi:hypothetical protein